MEGGPLPLVRLGQAVRVAAGVHFPQAVGCAANVPSSDDADSPSSTSSSPVAPARTAWGVAGALAPLPCQAVTCTSCARGTRSRCSLQWWATSDASPLPQHTHTLGNPPQLHTALCLLCGLQSFDGEIIHEGVVESAKSWALLRRGGGGEGGEGGM